MYYLPFPVCTEVLIDKTFPSILLVVSLVPMCHVQSVRKHPINDSLLGWHISIDCRLCDSTCSALLISTLDLHVSTRSVAYGRNTWACDITVGKLVKLSKSRNSSHILTKQCQTGRFVLWLIGLVILCPYYQNEIALKQ